MSDPNTKCFAALIKRTEQNSPWFVPIVRAAQQGITFSVATPDISVLGAPGHPDKGEVLKVGDDNIETVGPFSFPPPMRALVCNRIETAEQIVIVVCAPLTKFYQEAADAALAGKDVVLIETRRETQAEWIEFVKAHVQRSAVVTGGLVKPPTTTGS